MWVAGDKRPGGRTRTERDQGPKYQTREVGRQMAVELRRAAIPLTNQ
jgi:hypothetical protein